MSRNLKIYGHSDDCMEIEGFRPGEPDELGVYDSMGIVKIAVPDTDQGLMVCAEFDALRTGAWMIGLSQMESPSRDEGEPLPDWPIKWSQHSNGYSPQVEIEAPDDAVVYFVQPAGIDE